jgi:cupin 2 domain-containing protein
MEKPANPTFQHIRLVMFALGLIILFLAFLALVFGPQVGYGIALQVCGGLAAIVAVVFGVILLVNLVGIGFGKLFFRPKRKNKMRMGVSLNNLFEHIPSISPDELVQTLHDRKGCRVEKIVSRGHRTADDHWYDQETDEWVVLLSGSAGLRIEGRSEILALKPGDHLYLPAHQKHRVEYTDPNTDTLWLAVHFDPDAK